MKSGKWLVVALVAGLAACQSLPEPSGAEKARAGRRRRRASASGEAMARSDAVEDRDGKIDPRRR